MVLGGFDCVVEVVDCVFGVLFFELNFVELVVECGYLVFEVVDVCVNIVGVGGEFWNFGVCEFGFDVFDFGFDCFDFVVEVGDFVVEVGYLFVY